MTVLLLVLKVLGILLLAVLALLLLALLVPVTVRLCYAQGEFRVRLQVLFYTRQLWPEPPPRKQRKPRRQASRPAPAAGSAPKTENVPPAPVPTGPETAAPPQPEAKKEATVAGMPLRRLLDLLPTVGAVGRRILAGLRVHDVRLYWPIQGEDAADTALRYGKFCAAWGSVTGLLQNLVRIQYSQVQPVADYLGEHTGEEHFSCKITARVFIMVAAAVYGLIRLRQLAQTQTI